MVMTGLVSGACSAAGCDVHGREAHFGRIPWVEASQHPRVL